MYKKIKRKQGQVLSTASKNTKSTKAIKDFFLCSVITLDPVFLAFIVDLLGSNKFFLSPR